MRVHYINYKPDVDIVFFPATKRFFKVNANAKELINDIISSQNKNDAIKKYNISEEEYNTFYNNIFESINSDKVEKGRCGNLKVLNRLVVNITNDCNMRCKYCYADGGQYKSDRGLMSKDVWC